MILEYWHWVIFGMVMIAAEILVPGAFFLWVGIAALILGMLVFIFPFTTVSVQLILFGCIAVVSTVVGRKVLRKALMGGATTLPLLNQRGQQFIGETIVLDVPILNGHAHVTVADSKWRVKGPDLPVGTIVVVVGVEGNILIVAEKNS